MRATRRATLGTPVSGADRAISGPPYRLWPEFRWRTTSTTITASATPHASGAWTEVVASTSVDINMLAVLIFGTASANTDTSALLDIAVGGAGSETAVVSSLPAGYAQGTAIAGHRSMLPLNIAAGTRIACRLQALISSDTASVVLVGLSTSLRAPSAASLDTIGATTASSRGTNMPTSDTYVQLTSATTRPYSALVVLPAAGGSTSLASEFSTYTVGVGGSGSEVAVAVVQAETNISETVALSAGEPTYGLVPATIPTGSRIACKQSVGRAYRDVIVFGVPV